MRLGLRYNNADESMDVGPGSSLTRAQVAYSLSRAATEPSYVVPALTDQYGDVVLPPLSPDVLAVVKWGVGYVGYPYVWGGEWGLRSAEPSGLGGQAVAGFDCSGLVWWLMRGNDGGAWQVAPPRPYAGWTLAERSSADMARRGGSVPYDELKPGDLMFYDGNDDRRVDHVNTYIGNGWALDSSSSLGGVTIMWVADGWYRDHFVHGRRLIQAVAS
jgi:cell wall-associated NlpC family hydrolase